VQSGIRPVVIIQNDKGNKNSPTTIVAAITSRDKRSRLPAHAPLDSKNIKGQKVYLDDSVILFEQIFTINIYELRGYVGWIDLNEACFQEAIGISFAINRAFCGITSQDAYL